MVPIGNQVVAMGGYDGTYQSAFYKPFYKLGCVSQGCTWQNMIPLQLSVARYYHVAVVVPDDFFNCP